MLEYKAALINAPGDGVLDKDAVSQILLIMQGDDANLIDRSVPDTVQRQLSAGEHVQNTDRHKTTYDVVATLNTAWAYIAALVETVPRVDKAVSSGYALVTQLGPLVRRLMQAAGF
jgi:hypothetical protein